MSLTQSWSRPTSKIDSISNVRRPPLTFTGFLVQFQSVSSRAGAVVANLQIAAVMGAAAVFGQTLIVVCGDTDKQSFQKVFLMTIFLMVAQIHSELTHSNHKLARPVSRGRLARCSNHIFQAVMWLNVFFFSKQQLS